MPQTFVFQSVSLISGTNIILNTSPFRNRLVGFSMYLGRIWVYISSVTNEAASVVTEENPKKLRLQPKQNRLK